MHTNLYLSNTVLTTILLLLVLLGQMSGQANAQSLQKPLDYVGPITLSNNNLSNGAVIFRGAFNSNSWQGDLFAYSVGNDGNIINNDPLWSAIDQFAQAETSATYWQTRNIVFGATKLSFIWEELTNDQSSVRALIEATMDRNIVNYIRGDRINETNGMRPRASLLGAIIRSNPVFVGGNPAPYTNIADRTPHVYVGANDGMLHGFNAETGDETWAYIPSMLLPSLPLLNNINFRPTYYVDGGLNVQNAWFGDQWNTVLVGSLGAGGKGLFAVDVTDPGNSTTPGQQVLWELSADRDDDMGYIFGISSIIQLNDGNWYAANGNGFSSTNGDAVLYLVNIQTGLPQKIAISGAAGLSAPVFIDENRDGRVDLAYAGDLQGDLWRFDLTNVSNISSISPHKVYEGTPDQPISAAPSIARDPRGYWALFGTGRSYTALDNDTAAPQAIQAIYGIKDNLSTTTTVAPADLLVRALSVDLSYDSETVRTLDDATTTVGSSQKGWKINLPEGEKSLTPPRLRDGRVRLTTTKLHADDPSLNENWRMEVTYDQGSANAGDVFDLNNDGFIDSQDRVDGNSDSDQNDQENIPIAWRQNNGLLSQVTLARVSRYVDALFFNSVTLSGSYASMEGCIGDCEGGLEGGHIDVDTDKDINYYDTNGQITDSSNPYGYNTTDGHVHEYDDEIQRIPGATGRTYVDYFNINEELVETRRVLDNINGTPNQFFSGFSRTGADAVGNREFIILIANADLSPGADIIMGRDNAGVEIRYNVAIYQRMIHQALANWDGSGDLVDPNNGNSLIHTAISLQENGGTLRIQFDSHAIANGGVIPTSAGCVTGSNDIDEERWRNGALTMHLMERDHFLNATNALNQVRVQQPSDLVETLYIRGEVVDLSGSGGLRAEDSNGFLYESTIFWHYTGRACYGDSNYEEELLNVRFRLLLEQNGVDSRTASRIRITDGCDQIAATIAARSSSTLTIEECVALVDRADDNYYRSGGNPSGNGDTGNDGGGSTSGGPDSAGNVDRSADNIDSDNTFNRGLPLGRASWIDVLPP